MADWRKIGVCRFSLKRRQSVTWWTDCGWGPTCGSKCHGGRSKIMHSSCMILATQCLESFPVYVWRLPCKSHLDAVFLQVILRPRLCSISGRIGLKGLNSISNVDGGFTMLRICYCFNTHSAEATISILGDDASRCPMVTCVIH